MIHFDTQYSEGECPRDTTPDPGTMNMSSEDLSALGSQGLGTQQGASSTSSQQQQQNTTQSLQQLKDQAVQTGQELTQNVKSRASSFLDEQKSVAAGVLQDVAVATRHCREELQQKNYPRLSQAIDVIADRMDQFGQSLRQRDASYFVDRTQSFARQHPSVFLGGALALGFLAVRFLKSSGTPQGISYQQSQPSGAIQSSPSPQQQGVIQGIHDEAPASAGTQFTI